VRDGRLSLDPREWITDRITGVLRNYRSAITPG